MVKRKKAEIYWALDPTFPRVQLNSIVNEILPKSISISFKLRTSIFSCRLFC